MQFLHSDALAIKLSQNGTAIAGTKIKSQKISFLIQERSSLLMPQPVFSGSASVVFIIA